jgi:NTE family protein
MDETLLTRKDFLCAGAFPGGGALGTFHLGALEALEEYGYNLSVVAGDSIGGITAAIYAGNPPEQRLAKLRQFWKTVTLGDAWNLFGAYANNPWSKQLAFGTAATMGVPGFFKPRVLPGFGVAGSAAATSIYDTAPLRETLNEVIDFRYLNAADHPVRCMLGAVNVLSGQKVYFDSNKEKITVDHVMATGALPPAFPWVKIGNDAFWDGGLGINMPLDPILERVRRTNLLCFMSVLFPSVAQRLPENLDEVNRRVKELQFCARSAFKIDQIQEQHKLRLTFDRILKQMPSSLAAALTNAWPLGRSHVLKVEKIEHSPPTSDTAQSDADFRGSELEQRRLQGYNKMKETLARLELQWQEAEHKAVSEPSKLTVA